MGPKAPEPPPFSPAPPQSPGLEVPARTENTPAAELPDEETYDLNSGPGGRLDAPSQAQLESTGLTQHLTNTAPVRHPPKAQPEFWAAQTAHKNSIAAKLRAAGREDLAEDLEDCHSRFTVAQCQDCGRATPFPNRCDRFYCPECQPRLAHERRSSIEWWATLVERPRHVVLTVRNIPSLTAGHVHEFKQWLTRLRRRKFCANWRGGLWALEVTNEGRGWHLHAHLLVDAGWIDAPELARQWASVTGNSGKIVKVKDCSDRTYLAEVCKYAVKGVDLAKWEAADILQFIEAFTGQRAFGVFGSLYAVRGHFAEHLKEIRAQKPLCTCGSSRMRYFSDAEWEIHLSTCPTAAPRPPAPPAPNQPNLFQLPPARSTCVEAIRR